MQQSCGLNPMWFVLAVNVIAAFLIPFLTYRYAHKNNLKTLAEKWISEFRTASASYVAACDELYYANDNRYQKLSPPNSPIEADRVAYIKRCEEAQSKVTGARAKIRLLFKEGDAAFNKIQPSMEELMKSSDEPVTSTSPWHMDTSRRNKAQHNFLEVCNVVLTEEWGKISK